MTVVYAYAYCLHDKQGPLDGAHGRREQLMMGLAL